MSIAALSLSPPRPRLAVMAIGVFALCCLIGLYGPRPAAPSAMPAEGGRDLEAYRQIVERIHGGENYYDAAGAVLRPGGYPTSSVFNWRPPLSAWLLAVFPRHQWAQGLLAGLALLALGFAYQAECRRSSVGRALVLVTLMSGAFLWCIDGDAYFAQELWAGVLIALSVSAFAAGQRPVAVVAGLAALFVRELALPYVAVCALLAVYEKRPREAAAWVIGSAGWALFFAWHACQVQARLTPFEHVEAEGWIQLGGPAFVIHTSQMNVWLFNLPAWLAVLYLAVALFGLAQARTAPALRISLPVAMYLMAFLIVGKACNGYWGLLYVALLPWGVVNAGSAWGCMIRARRNYHARCHAEPRHAAAD